MEGNKQSRKNKIQKCVKIKKSSLRQNYKMLKTIERIILYRQLNMYLCMYV